MTHDERLVPAREGRDLDRSLADLTQTKPYGRYGNTASDINLKEYLFVVLKRKWLIMSLVLVITSLATIQAYREPSIYEGATTIKIEQKAQSILQSGSGGIVIGQNDPNFWGTQLKLLQNPTLARQVVVTLNLQHNPRFFGPQGQSSIFASLKRIFSREKVVQSPTQNGGGTAPINEETLKERQLTAEEQAALEPYEDTIVANEIVEPVAQTNLVIIRYRHTDPLLAQKIADTLADVFIANNVERQESGTSKAAQDLAQETLIAAWKSIARYNGQCQFGTWLCSILFHKHRSALRRSRWLRLITDLTVGAESVSERIRDEAPTPDHAVQISERSHQILLALERLPAKQREVIFLRFYADESLEGIAAATNHSTGTVKSRLFHALENLRQMRIFKEELR